jgi:membrane protease YdiL (CAAX protease family)
MNFLTRQFQRSPVIPRVAPFVLFLVFTFCQGQFGEGSRYWCYVIKTFIGAWLVWSMRPWVSEMKWAISWEAVLAGVGVFVFWVGLDGLYPNLTDLYDAWLAPLMRRIGLGSDTVQANDETPLWNPYVYFHSNAALAGLVISVRILGSTFVVPPLEEVFYRSFLYRYLVQADFQSVPLGQFRWMPFLFTAMIFGLAHREWLAGILCAFVYQALVCWKKRLGDAMTAHAITNFLLGLWVVWKGAWNFW